MTWTYNPVTGIPPAWPTVKDHIRFLLQDTRQSSLSVSDEDIAGAILLWNDAFPDYPDNANGIAATIAIGIADVVSIQGVDQEYKYVGTLRVMKKYALNRRLAWLRLASRIAGGCPIPVPGATMGGFGLAAGSALSPDRLFTVGQFDDYSSAPSSDYASHSILR